MSLTHSSLIRWIDDHDRPEPTIDNGDNTLTVSSHSLTSNGALIIEREVIPATLAAARDLLGY